MNGNIMAEIFVIEIISTTLIFIISCYELATVVKARMEKLTNNLSRIISHLIICLIALVIFVNSWHWFIYIKRVAVDKWENLTFINWPFLLMSFMLGGLIIYEFFGIHYAKKYGFTTNKTRLISHFLMLILFCVLVFLSLKKWDIYIEILKQPKPGL